MRGLAAVSLCGVATVLASAARAQNAPGELPSPYIQQVPPAPAVGPDGRELPPPGVDPDLDPNADAYAGEYDLSSDNAVAQTYDDGYDPQAAAEFEETLSPYGSWVDDAAYGRVWIPAADTVGLDFSPYATGGHWALTEFGWTWISDWDWGWAPFHFGRWTVLGGRGWCWVPGTVWGPAWVSWRAGGGYVGWAPMPPRSVWIGQPVGSHSPWRFIEASHMGMPRPGYVPPAGMPGAVRRTAVVSNAHVLSSGGTRTVVNAGPTRIAPAGQYPATAGRLAELAPHALPRFAVRPRVGAALASRPWVRAGVTHQAQAPAFRDSPPAGPAPLRASAGEPGHRGPATSGPRAGSLNAAAARTPSGRFHGPASAAPPAHAPVASAPSGYGRIAPSSGTTAAPAARSAPYAPPARASNPAPVRVYTPPPIYHPPVYRSPVARGPIYQQSPSPTPAPPRSYAPPAQVSAPRYAAPPQHYAAPAPQYSAPAPRYPAPAPQFSAPSHSSAPGGFGHAGGGSLGGRRR